MEQKVKISVRDLVSYVYRRGSIDSGFKKRDVMLEGIKAHQKIQSLQDENYEKEKTIKYETTFKGLTFEIQGRCDGLIHEEIKVIDEIKSVSRNLNEIEEDYNEMHWAQAKIYAWMYGKLNAEKELIVQLTYYNIFSENIKKFKKLYTLTSLEDFIEGLLTQYVKFLELKLKIEREQISTCKELQFPFDFYRKGQKKLMSQVYSSIKDRKRLFVKAPTGIGKTISTIFPSLKAIADEEINQIIYLTAKTITRTVAENTFNLLAKQGLKMKVVSLTAKTKICFMEEVKCQKEYCPYANGYFDRLNDALIDILEHEDIMYRDTIIAYAKKHQICPFEFSLELSYGAGAVICDYNYVFDPRVSLRGFGALEDKNTILLVDEAHNLPDRSREMYSAQIKKSNVLMLRRQFKNIDKGLFEVLNRINQYLNLERKELINNVKLQEDLPIQFIIYINQFIDLCEDWLINNPQSVLYKDVIEFYFECMAFEQISNLYDKRFITYITSEYDDLVIKMFCMDPSYLLKRVCRNYSSTIFFSATLIPMTYYFEILGGRKKDHTLKLSSPFQREKLKVYVYDISTKLRMRQMTAPYIAQLLTNMVNKNPGNYLFFFPSYSYMASINEEFCKLENSQIEIITQEKDMQESDKEIFLSKFLESSTQSIIGFAVLGGIFSEGIDLKGNALNGVAVVGVGLPQICLERDLIKDYYSKNNKPGFDYAYTFPGMNKVLQAGGRVIRTEEDEGILLLVGERFLTNHYQKQFPTEWTHYKKINK